jgi:hypothetical protein
VPSHSDKLSCLAASWHVGLIRATHFGGTLKTEWVWRLVQPIHIKRQATQNDILPSLLGDRDQWSEIVFVQGLLEQPRQDKNLLYWHEEPNEPIKEGHRHMYSLDPHLPQFQQWAGATPLCSLWLSLCWIMLNYRWWLVSNAVGIVILLPQALTMLALASVKDCAAAWMSVGWQRH